MKTFSDLTEQEIIALAISSEDDDARAYAGFAHALMGDYPASAKVFVEMAGKSINTAAGSLIYTKRNLAISFR